MLITNLHSKVTVMTLMFTTLAVIEPSIRRRAFMPIPLISLKICLGDVRTITAIMSAKPLCKLAVHLYLLTCSTQTYGPNENRFM